MGQNATKADVAAALVAGALLGAGVALLFAPQSGERTRRDIRRAAEKARNKVDGIRLEAQRAIDELADDVSDRLEEEFTRGKDWTENKLASLRKVLNSGKKLFQEEIEKIAHS